MLSRFGFLVVAGACLWAGAGLVSLHAEDVDVSKLPLPVPRKVDFVKEIYPVFVEKCIDCHGPKKQKGKYRMDTREHAMKPGDDGPFILVGNSEKSSIVHMVAGLIDEGLMPPPSDKPGQSEPLTREQISVLRAWIDQGAEWPDGEIQMEETKYTFAEQVGPVLQQACGSCHGPAKQEGGFRLDTLAALLQGGEFYGPTIKPGDVKGSGFLVIIAGKDGDMPLPDKHKMPEKQVEMISKWIAQGAK